MIQPTTRSAISANCSSGVSEMHSHLKYIMNVKFVYFVLDVGPETNSKLVLLFTYTGSCFEISNTLTLKWIVTKSLCIYKQFAIYT